MDFAYKPPLHDPRALIKNNKEGKGKPLIGTKAFTVINQIYLQFIQMFNLQQKYKKTFHKMQNQETSSLETPLLYQAQNVEGNCKEQKGHLGRSHRKKKKTGSAYPLAPLSTLPWCSIWSR